MGGCGFAGLLRNICYLLGWAEITHFSIKKYQISLYSKPIPIVIQNYQFSVSMVKLEEHMSANNKKRIYKNKTKNITFNKARHLSFLSPFNLFLIVCTPS